MKKSEKTHFLPSGFSFLDLLLPLFERAHTAPHTKTYAMSKQLTGDELEEVEVKRRGVWEITQRGGNGESTKAVEEKCKRIEEKKKKTERRGRGHVENREGLRNDPKRTTDK